MPSAAAPAPFGVVCGAGASDGVATGAAAAARGATSPIARSLPRALDGGAHVVRPGSRGIDLDGPPLGGGVDPRRLDPAQMEAQVAPLTGAVRAPVGEAGAVRSVAFIEVVRFTWRSIFHAGIWLNYTPRWYSVSVGGCKPVRRTSTV